VALVASTVAVAAATAVLEAVAARAEPSMFDRIQPNQLHLQRVALSEPRLSALHLSRTALTRLQRSELHLSSIIPVRSQLSTSRLG
jgi:hypothetical protein